MRFENGKAVCDRCGFDYDPAELTIQSGYWVCPNCYDTDDVRWDINGTELARYRQNNEAIPE